MTDDDWLTRISKEPGPDTRRAYEAWLAQQGDPRAKLLALEERCRALDPTTDEYWSLKRKRNALRDATDRTWRKRLGYGAERATAPSTWPKSLLGRWRMVREVIDVVQGVRLGDAGRACARIKAIEKKCRVKLGAGLREWVLLVDDLLADEANWESVFRDSVSLEPIDGTKAFSLLLQGEGDFHWAVSLANLGKDDPPVITFRLDEEQGRFVPHKGGTGTYAGAKRLTDWARAFVLGYADSVGPHARLRD